MSIELKQQEFTDQTPFPFGRYEHMPLENVPVGFLIAIRDSERIRDYPGLKKYIDDQMPQLEKKLRELLKRKLEGESDE